MSDTGFLVSPEARRAATMYRLDGRDRRRQDVWAPARQAAAFCTAGGGLISTADDYLRFVGMMLGNGSVDGVRVLTAGAVRMMRRPAQRRTKRHPFLGSPFWLGRGFGLGLSLVTDPEKSAPGSGRAGSERSAGRRVRDLVASGSVCRDMVLMYLIQKCPIYRSTPTPRWPAIRRLPSCGRCNRGSSAKRIARWVCSGKAPPMADYPPDRIAGPRLLLRLPCPTTRARCPRGSPAIPR